MEYLRTVEESINSPLCLGDTWEAISLNWFSKWKSFMSETNNEKQFDLYAEPIDNSLLEGDIKSELRQDLINGVDYVLLPSETANVLFSKYNGGPRFPREVINVGSNNFPSYQISLFRVRVEAYHCNLSCPQPRKSKNYTVKFFTKTTLLREVIDVLAKENFQIDTDSFLCRMWLKDGLDIASDSKHNLEDDNSTIRNSFNNNNAKRARYRRLLTEDITNRVGDWKFYTHIPQYSTILEMLGGNDSVQLIIESAAKVGNCNYCPEDKWPRAHMLTQWKFEVSIGDMCDTQDKTKTWYTSVVKGVDAVTGAVSVHFQGWSSQFDETIPMNEIAKRIAPLYSQTFKRSDWKKGDKVDFRATCLNVKPVWINATIHSVELSANDPLTDKLQLEFHAKERIDALSKFAIPVESINTGWLAASSNNNSATSLSSYNSFDDDSIKRKMECDASTDSSDCNISSSSYCITTRNSSSGNGSSPTNTDYAMAGVLEDVRLEENDKRKDNTESSSSSSWKNDQKRVITSTAVARGNNDVVRVWVEVLGDDVCPIHTHTKKPATTAPPPPPPPSSPQSSYASNSSSSCTALTIRQNRDDDDDDDDISKTFTSIKNNHSSFASPIRNYLTEPLKYIQNIGSGKSNKFSSYSGDNNSSYSGSNYFTSEKQVRGTPDVAGAVGLQNLGNTCFMNSILQCVSHTEALTSELFTTSSSSSSGRKDVDGDTEAAYVSQINRDNPLGHSGKLVLAYAKLVKDMWSNIYTKVIPREFKFTIGEFQPQFAGYEQQDSQEFLGFLLDGLHEDLNRVQRKPHVSKIESKGRSDVVIASESWRRYLLRNDSALVESCFGQLKSHVTCTNCGAESVTFDEYSSLSLPIPLKSNTRSITVYLHPLPVGSKPIQLTLDVEVTAPMSELKKILADKLEELYTQGIILLPTTCSPSSTSVLSASSTVSVTDDNMDIDSNTFDNSATSHLMNDLNVQLLSDASEVVVNTEGSFEMVPHYNTPANTITSITIANDEDEKSFVTVSKSQTPSQIHSVSDIDDDIVVATAISSSTSSQSYRITSKSHLQFATVSSFRPTTLTRNYHSAEAAAEAVHKFVSKNECLVVFQLMHEAPEIRSRYITSYTSNGSNKNSQLKYNSADETSEYITVDVLVGISGNSTPMKSYSSSNYVGYDYINYVGIPNRITVSRQSTNRQVLRQIRRLVQRYCINEQDDDADNDNTNGSVDEEDMYGTSATTAAAIDGGASSDSSSSSCPYRIVVTGTYGSVIRRQINNDDQLFQPAVSGQEQVVVLWSSRLNPHYDQEGEKCIEVNQQQHHHGEDSSGASSAKMSIYQCLDKFIEREHLAETETLYCGKCKQHLAPIKKMDIWAAPDILVLHLKRFLYVPGQFFVHREKISELVDFPIQGLDLSKYVIGPQYTETAPPIYDLYAVSHHSGGLGGGHYTATCKNFINDKWYNFNDSCVSNTSPNSCVTATAYVLFYKRRVGKLKWAGIIPSAEPMPDE